jgi:hypothetical protein
MLPRGRGFSAVANAVRRVWARAKAANIVVAKVIVANVFMANPLAGVSYTV